MNPVTGSADSFSACTARQNLTLGSFRRHRLEVSGSFGLEAETQTAPKNLQRVSVVRLLARLAESGSSEPTICSEAASRAASAAHLSLLAAPRKSKYEGCGEERRSVFPQRNIPTLHFALFLQESHSSSQRPAYVHRAIVSPKRSWSPLLAGCSTAHRLLPLHIS